MRLYFLYRYILYMETICTVLNLLKDILLKHIRTFDATRCFINIIYVILLSNKN